MDRSTVVRIAIPLSLYESVKGKVLNEAKKTVDPAKKKAEMAEKKKIEAKKAAEKKKGNIKENSKYRNPNNKIKDDGTYSVINYASSSGKPKFTGTREECKEYIEQKLDGDFDDYGIIKN